MIFYYLCEYPEIRTLVMVEIKHLLNKDLKWDDLKHLHYLDAVIKETQRMYGPVVSLAPRKVKKFHKLGSILMLKGKNIFIYIGTLVTVDVAANHHNHRYYPDPLYFNPERWLNKPVDA